MREHWEAQADSYYTKRGWSAADARVVELLGQHQHERWLEVGIGPGIVGAAAKRRWPAMRYYGLDLARNFLHLSRARLGRDLPLIQAAAEWLPLKTASFDGVLEMDTIHHLPRQLIPRTVAEISRIIKPGGRLISVEDWATIPDDERARLAYSLQAKRHSVAEGWEYHPSEPEWTVMFTAAGLHVESIEHPWRPLDLALFASLPHMAARAELRRLKGIWGDDLPTTTMSLFICRKV